MHVRANLELFKGELGNDFWVSFAVLTVGVVRKEGVLHSALVHAVKGGVNPLHLIEDHTLASDVILHAMLLLAKCADVTKLN